MIFLGGYVDGVCDLAFRGGVRANHLTMSVATMQAVGSREQTPPSAVLTGD
jgi:hypothetical protein